MTSIKQTEKHEKKKKKIMIRLNNHGKQVNDCVSDS